MYKPPYALSIKDLPHQQIRLGLMGPSGTGKTTGALTFPNPTVIDIDNNLIAHKKREDVTVLPFTSNDWIRDKLGFKYNMNEVKFPIRDAVKYYLKTEAQKLEADQTLVLDSWTTLQDEFDKQSDPSLEPVRSSDGSINSYAFWDKKIDYALEILTILKTLKCHVVVSFHQQEPRGEYGSKMLGKLEPLMQGKFVKKIGLYFTDFYQCVVEHDKDATGKITGKSKFYWRTKSNGDVDLKSRMIDCPVLIEPNYKSFTY